MSRTSRYRPVVWIRRLLLVALVLFLGVVTALLIEGRRGQVAANDDELGLELAGRSSDEVRAGESFEHEVTEDGEPRYVIAADRWISTRENLMTLEGINLRILGKDGADTLIEADTGTYHQESATASLEGNVRIVRTDGFEIRGEGFELRRKGQVVASTVRPVRLRYADRFRGRSREVTAHLHRNRYQLAGGVEISSADGETTDVGISCKRLTYEEDIQMLHAEGDVVLRHDGDEIRAGRLSVHLDEQGKVAQFVRARWDVSGNHSSIKDGVTSEVRFVANELSVQFDTQGKELEAVELDGLASRPAVLDLVQLGGQVRRMTSPYVTIDFAAGALRQARAEGPVQLIDFLEFDSENPLGTACGESADASFDESGSFERVVLRGGEAGVDVNRPGFQVSGQTVETRGDGDRIVVVGKPARVISRRGGFDAPRITYHPGKGNGKATGGVRAVLPGEGDFGLMTRAAEGDEPIHITAEEAQWSEDADEFRFSGGVRAWQNENFLIAQQLTGTDSGQTLTASGAVKTVLKRTEKPTTPSGSVDESGSKTVDEEEEIDAPIEVTAAKLIYSGQSERLHYTGRPRAQQAGRSLVCDDLNIQLGEESELEELVCSGNSEVSNPKLGQRVTGDKAVYRPEDSSVEVSGQPVVLTENDGGTIRGGVILYDLETGRAQIKTGSPVLLESVPENVEATAAAEDTRRIPAAAPEGRDGRGT